MDSIEKGATIRIGLKKYYKDADDVLFDFSVPTYSLKVDKKSVLVCGCAGRSEDYFDIYQKAGIEIGKMMKEKSVDNYVLYNGEMVDMWSKKWESCGCVPKDGEEIFRKSLENTLKLD